MIKLEVTALMGNILSRLLVVEIEYQKKWIEEEKECFKIPHQPVRKRIIEQCEELLKDLENEGIQRYFICDYSKIGNDY